MGKKVMRLPFLSDSSGSSSTSSWPWPAYCHQPSTLSFRKSHDMFKTSNSAFLDPTNDVVNTPPPPPESWFTHSSESGGGGDNDVCVETVIRGLSYSSERLFFEPGETSSILEEKSKVEYVPFKESVALSMESQDPYVDFKKSMEEMVEAHGLRDWEVLEELLWCYLRVNDKSNHGYIVGAFVDLLVGLAFTASATCTITSTTRPVGDSCCCFHDSLSSSSSSSFSPLSFYTSTCSDDSSSTPNCESNSLLQGEEQPEEIDISPCSSSLKEVDKNVINEI